MSSTSAETHAPSALGESFFVISRAFYAYVVLLERLLEEFRLNDSVRPGMGHVLFTLFEQDDLIMKDLVERTQLAPSTLTRLVRRMEKHGLITRRRCSNDGRAVRIRLTRRGRRLEKRCFGVMERVRAIVQRGMAAEEVDSVKAGLAKMIDNMRGYEIRCTW